jgi:hypothetical protein
MKSNCVISMTLLIVAALVMPARAEVSYSTVPGDLTSSVIKMTVTPAAAPSPVFKHRFVPDDIDLKSGNAAPYYYRALLDLPRRRDDVRKKYSEDEQEKWYRTDHESLPIDQLPVDKMREVVEMSVGGWVTDQLMEATHRRECDFELGLSEVRGIELIYISLEEFQRSREISRMLALKTRLAVAEKRYDDAIATMRMNYRLAENFGSLPFIVSGLIGIAEARVTNGTALELIAHPGSPNLYWALSELPQPLISMRDAARFELDFGPRLFPYIHNAETADRSYDEWNRMLVEAFRELIKTGSDMQLFGGAPLFGGGSVLEGEYGAGLMATASALGGYTHAKERLIAGGMDRARAESMSVGQVMAIYTERNYQSFADEWESLWYLPYWETRRYENVMEDRVARSRVFAGGPDREVIPLVSLLLPAMQAARSAQVRLEREAASLRTIEALRMYAANHDGKLPASLADVKEVYVPNNPATGKPFEYRLEAGTAILDLPASDGIIGDNRRFEIQIVKE